jgi:hypothetical protein
MRMRLNGIKKRRPNAKYRGASESGLIHELYPGHRVSKTRLDECWTGMYTSRELVNLSQLMQESVAES